LWKKRVEQKKKIIFFELHSPSREWGHKKTRKEEATRGNLAKSYERK